MKAGILHILYYRLAKQQLLIICVLTLSIATDVLGDNRGNISDCVIPGIVKNDMVFEAHENKGVFITEGIDTPYELVTGHLIYRNNNGSPITPPMGIRSAVPLGGIGAGTFELRADGNFKDWQIFNNTGWKPDLKFNLFSLRVQSQATDNMMIKGGKAIARVLSTHPPAELPSIQKIEYRGLFPVSELKYDDPDIPVQISLKAFSTFKPHDSKSSAIPAAYFVFKLVNTSTEPRRVSVMFSLENCFDGKFFPENKYGSNGFTLSRKGEDAAAGSLSFAFLNNNGSSSYFGNFTELWQNFARKGYLENPNSESITTSGVSPIPDALEPFYKPNLIIGAPIAATTTDVFLKAGESQEVVGILAWYFPNQYYSGMYNNGSGPFVASCEKSPAKKVGHQYSNWFFDSRSVLDYANKHLAESRHSAKLWHNWCCENSLPDWFRNTLANNLSSIYKTSYWWENGQYRQLESFCSGALNPIHLYFYASMEFNTLFPDLSAGLLDSYAKKQRANGYINEHLGGWGSFEPVSREHFTDTNSDYILMVYQHFLLTGDIDFLHKHWLSVKRAFDYMVMKANPKWGLPTNGGCTWDIHFYEKYNLNSYTSFLYLAALKSLASMGDVLNENEFVLKVNKAYEKGQNSLNTYLWNGKFYRDHWDEKLSLTNFINADHIFGQVCARNLGFGELTDPKKIRSSLDSILTYGNPISPYGLRLFLDVNTVGESNCTSPDKENWDYLDSIWPAPCFNVAAEAIYQDKVDKGMDLAKEVCDHYALNLCNLWNWPDCHDSIDGLPTANSNYRRQMNFINVLLALSGFKYNAAKEELEFNPKLEAPFVIPFITPKAMGFYCTEKDRIKVEIIEGELNLRRLILTEKRDFSEAYISYPARHKIIDKTLITEFEKGLSLNSQKPLVIDLKKSGR